MAYIVVSAGWNANHQVVEFFNNDEAGEKKCNAFYQSNEKVFYIPCTLDGGDMDQKANRSFNIGQKLSRRRRYVHFISYR